jgi:hypothetical protein
MTASADLDAFLRARRVAVIALPRATGKPPLTTPIWYDWDGTVFRLEVEVTSAKGKLLARGPLPVSLTIQSEVAPYRYAIAYGTATLGPLEPGLRARLAYRYFGRTAGNLYLQQQDAAGRGDELLCTVRIVPERFATHDFRPEAGVTGRLWFGLWRWFHPSPA